MSAVVEKSTEKVRVQLDLNPHEIERLRSLMVACGLDTRKDLVNHALTLFGWAVEEIREGRVVGSLDKVTKEFTVVSMPGLALAKSLGTPAPTLVPVEGRRPANQADNAKAPTRTERKLSPVEV